MDIKYNNHTSRVESNSMQFVIAYETDIYGQFRVFRVKAYLF